MVDNCGKYGEYGNTRVTIVQGQINPVEMKTLSQEYDRGCDCIQCLQRRRTYLKMVIHNLKQHEGWEKAISRHQSEMETIAEKLE